MSLVGNNVIASYFSLMICTADADDDVVEMHWLTQLEQLHLGE